MFKKYYLMPLLAFCAVLFISCKNEKKEPLVKKNTTEIQKDGISKKEKDTKIIAAKISKNPIYNAADQLNMIVFGKRLKHLDFSTISNKIPDPATLLDFKELVNIRAYKEPKYSTYNVGDKLIHYAYFIFQYDSGEIAQKRLDTFFKEAEIMHKVAADEVSYETLSNRKKNIYSNSKYGAIVFRSNQNIIFVKNDCSKSNASNRLSWPTYKKMFINSLSDTIQNQLLNSVCDDYRWEKQSL